MEQKYVLDYKDNNTEELTGIEKVDKIFNRYRPKLEQVEGDGRWHTENALEHTINVLEEMKALIKKYDGLEEYKNLLISAALLHDIGKKEPKNDKEHPVRSWEYVKDEIPQIFDENQKETLEYLIKDHMTFFHPNGPLTSYKPTYEEQILMLALHLADIKGSQYNKKFEGLATQYNKNVERVLEKYLNHKYKIEIKEKNKEKEFSLDRLINELENGKNENKGKYVIIPIGISASGKSYTYEQLKRELETKGLSIESISYDKIREQIYEKKYGEPPKNYNEMYKKFLQDRSLEKDLKREFINSLESAIRDESINIVYIDNLNHTLKSREKIINWTKEFGRKYNKDIHVIYLYYTPNLWKSLKNNSKAKKLHPRVIMQQLAQFDKPTENENYERLYVIDGDLENQTK